MGHESQWVGSRGLSSSMEVLIEFGGFVVSISNSIPGIRLVSSVLLWYVSFFTFFVAFL